MNKNTYEALQNRVRELIRLHNLLWKWLQEIIKELEWKVVVLEIDTKTIVWESCAGFIYKDGDIFYIWVEESDFELRKRFTVAHELGHYFMHGSQFEDKESIIDTTLFRLTGSTQESKDLREQEANEFAAELLMPYDKFTKSVNSMKIKLGEVYEDVLAFDYQVSASAVKFRIKNLWL